MYIYYTSEKLFYHSSKYAVWQESFEGQILWIAQNWFSKEIWESFCAILVVSESFKFNLCQKDFVVIKGSPKSSKIFSLKFSCPMVCTCHHFLTLPPNSRLVKVCNFGFYVLRCYNDFTEMGSYTEHGLSISIILIDREC